LILILKPGKLALAACFYVSPAPPPAPSAPSFLMDPKDEIKQKLSIVELVGEYLELKQASSTGFKACCPFHSEKTPSFFVSDEKQIWHCFGCGEGGDCFSFVMKMEGLEFPEALRLLGKKAGVEIKRFSSQESNERQRLLAMNELAGKYFQKVLTDATSAKVARDYLNKRGISIELIEKFGLGFAPDQWESLSQLLIKRGYSEHECIKAGLSLKSKKGRGVIDRFRKRVMVPLRDHHSNTVGFTGRSMPGDEYGPKYMNSPETPIYSKGKLLYGLDLAKQAIKHKQQVIIVEGNLDVVASHKAQVENIVASSGTALTSDQLSLLKRYTDTIVFSFDQDAAGFTAAQRGIREARKLEFNIRSVVIPEDAGKDPDDVVQNDPALWQQIVSQSVPIMEYFIEQALRDRDLANVDDKKTIGKMLLPEIASIVDVVEREHWLQKVADLLRIDAAILRSSIKPSAPSAPSATSAPSIHRQSQRISKEEQAAHDILGLFIQQHEAVVYTYNQEIFPSKNLQTLYKIIISAYNQYQSNKSAQKSLYLRAQEQISSQDNQAELIPLLDQISLNGERILASISQNQVSAQLSSSINVLTNSLKTTQRLDLQAQIRQAEALQDKERVEQLIHQFNTLQKNDPSAGSS